MRQAAQVQDRPEEHEDPSLRQAGDDLVGRLEVRERRHDGKQRQLLGGLDHDHHGLVLRLLGATGATAGTGSGGGLQADGCDPGQDIPQGAFAGDGDEDNTGMPDDGDGCL